MIASKTRAFKREDQKLMVIFGGLLLSIPLVVMLCATAISRM